MIDIFHLFWIIPICVFAGYILGAILSVGKDDKEI
jgi:hypothetical protein